MSFPTAIPATAIEFVLALLLPLLLPRLGGDAAIARALALDLLAEHAPRTARELRLAGEAIGHSVQGLVMLAQSAEPDIAAKELETALKWATRLARSAHQAQARLDALQRAAQADHVTTADPENATAPAAPEPAAPSVAPPVAPPAPAPSVAADAAPVSDVARAEAALHSAEQLLGLMKAHWKGAPAPHTKAAQDIRAQQRITDVARLALVQARRRAHTGAAPAAVPA